MAGGDVLIPGTTLLLTPATTFFSRNAHELTAALTVVLTLALAVAADRWVARRAARGRLRPEIDTRVRFLRRLVALVIVLLGGLFALSQFGGLSRLATGVLASSAIVAAIVGFAARQTLANLVAGVMLMIAQPLRIGDQVTVEGDTGVIDDVRLNYTVLRTWEGRRVFIPNERLASGVLRNDTIIDAHVRPEVSLWIPLAGDTAQALELARAVEPELVARAAEVTPDGVRITVTGAPVHAEQRAAREAELRLALLSALRAESLLSGSPPS
jgi:small-conductance mechanosensitive channel